MKEEKEWKEIFGCQGWFDKKDAFFEVVTHTKAAMVSSNDGPIWTVVGEKDDDLLISVNLLNVSTVPKKFVRVLTPLLS